jgi:hypothetical protein
VPRIAAVATAVFLALKYAFVQTVRAVYLVQTANAALAAFLVGMIGVP